MPHAPEPRTNEDKLTELPSDAINVRLYNNILIWPLLLQGKPLPQDDTPILERWVKLLTGQAADPGHAPCDENCHCEVQGTGGTGINWKDVTSKVNEDFGYDAIVYFHPFVRDFLFADGKTELKDRTTRVLANTCIRGMRVTLSDGEQLTLEVERLNLVLTKPNVALLVVDLSKATGEDGTDAGDFLSLSSVLRFQDQIRRTYPAFWEADGSMGLCPRKVEWLIGGESATVSTNQPTDLGVLRADFEQFVTRHAEPPIVHHWRVLLGKYLIPFEDAADRRCSVQQILDERIPSMSFLAVDEPGEVAPEDLDRLVFVDPPGAGFPYDPDFIAKTRDEHCYQRFAHFDTRYFSAGYSFVALGRYDADVPEDRFTFSRKARRIFRNHYLLMGILVHYQRAALLYFADELSYSKKRQLEGSYSDSRDEMLDPKFRQDVEDIQWQFLKFRARSYFVEVSNQVQAQELYELWRKHLPTESLFQLVNATSQQLTATMAEREARHLNTAATVGLTVGVALAVISVWAALPGTASGQELLSWVLGVSSVLCLIGFARFMPKPMRLRRWLESLTSRSRE